ncbi:protein ENDOSPERM DEFECTIVE 1-like [Herrania umbratica]|uniref:Protein ENDOSPERM DEFECTIVE 1-like n=1 Tax=Herrania umbratica TaxID=108875 RepID=A0A6J1B627_9ROSI|nr:protein ENDOSPERM DEFECTIVE 1-like [Herrania umbratica]
MMVQAGGVVESSHAVAPPLPHPPQRRPRVREVSSRFMSPVASSYSGEPARSPLLKQQRSISTQRQRRQLEMEADENRPAPSETPRRLESSFVNTNSSSNIQKKDHHCRTYSDSGKLFGRSTTGAPSKPDTPTPTPTPTPTITSFDRSATLSSSSRIRLNHRSANISSTATASAAAKLSQSSGMALSSKSNVSSPSQEASSVSSNDMGSTVRSLINFRSSMPEADLLPPVSTRLLTDRNVNNAVDSSKLPASPFSRSLNSPLSTCEPSLFHHPNPSIKGVSTRMGPLSLPLVPSHTKIGTDAIRRPKKVSSHQEDLHSLKLLHNYYLQWRYANANAEASMKIQKGETERTLYSLEVRIAELNDCVRRKRIELELLQRMKTLSKILEAQMPYLEEWSALQGDYLNSLSEAIQSLLNTSLRLPISGNVKADTRKVAEAMKSAIKLMEMILCHVQSFMPKAEEMERLISELARVAGGERALIDECGDLLSKTNTFLLEESSLRGQLMQLQLVRVPVNSNHM